MSLSKLSTTRFLVFVADIFMSSSKRPNVQTSKCPIVDWQGDDAQVIPDIFCNSPTGGTSTSSNHRPVNGVSSSSSRFFFVLIKVILMLMLIADADYSGYADYTITVQFYTISIQFKDVIYRQY